jgi:hypothetical protein
MAASGTTKKITSNQILGAGGTATLASATITGDLTVDTSTLKVDSANNRVGIGTATPANTLEVVAPAGDNIVSTFRSGDATAANNAGGGFRSISSATAASRVAQVWLDADGADLSGGDYFFIQKNGNSGTVEFNQFSNAAMIFSTYGTERARIDSSGNVGVGVTPSAWSSPYKSIELDGGNLSVYPTTDFYISQNAVNVGGWKYKATGFASQYIQVNSQHRWQIAASGTAGNAITFTQAMTLDASGNLLVGKTARDLTTAGVEVLPSGQTTVIVASSAGGFTTSEVYSTTAAAYRFYVGMNGTVSATNTTISAISDARLKENVQDIDVGLAAILALKPRKFDWKAGKGKDIKGDRGFIAQEFETVFPNLIDEWKDEAPEGEAPYKSVRQDLIPVLVKAIQELTARVQTLEAK